jgi:endonuclease G
MLQKIQVIFFSILCSLALSPTDRPGSASIEQLLIVIPLSSSPAVEKVSHAFYSLGYSEIWEQARWVSYFASSGHSTGTAQRRNDFRIDTSVSTGSAELSDYYESGFDRGHLAPAHDFSWSASALSETFFMSNISPQVPSFNRGIWLSLENKIRDIVASGNELIIVVGPIVDPADNSIGDNQVKVPSRFFKAFIARSNTSVNADWFGAGYILNNSQEKQSLESSIVTIDQIEEITKLDLFSALDDSTEKRVEQQASLDWQDMPEKVSPENYESSKEPARETSSVQCNGLTQKAQRCKRKTKSENGYCHQHQSQQK